MSAEIIQFVPRGYDPRRYPAREPELSEYIGEEGTGRIFKRNDAGDYVELCPNCYDLTVWPPVLFDTAPSEMNPEEPA